MSFIPWSAWTKPRAWRKLADELAKKDEYVVIGIARDDDEDSPFELLRLSRYSPDFDADKMAISTPIRRFDEAPVELSRRTRDLGLVRFITNKGKPIFVLEPGADVIEWMASRESVPAKLFLNVARRGELGRAVRRKDRRALKASQQEIQAKISAHDEYVKKLELDLAEARVEAQEYRDAHAKMVENIGRQNERSGAKPGGSGSMACALGAAEKRGFKPTTNKALPGHFEGSGS